MFVHNDAIEFVFSAWITALVILILLFVRYGFRTTTRLSLSTWKGVYWQVSAAIAMSVYDFGNLFLIIWFWHKIHYGVLNITGTTFDECIIIIGCLFSIAGLFCKIRVFSDNNAETLAALALIAASSTALTVVYHTL